MRSLNQSNSKLIPMLSTLYLCIPVIAFLIFWIKPIFSTPLVLLVVYSLYETFKKINSFELKPSGNRLKIAIIFVILLIWVVSSGIGGLVWQNRTDHMFRNALFQDLVNYNWPVVDDSYGYTRLLCYYIGFWLPSALIGKLFGFQVGYVFQIVWAFVGVALAFSLLSEYIKKVSILAALAFVLFSGLDVVIFFLGKTISGSLPSALPELLSGIHMELKLYQFNSSSNTTLLYWVYNQTIPFWIGFLLLLRQKSNKIRLFLFMLLLLFAPFPSVAILPLIIYQFLRPSCQTDSSCAKGFPAFIRNSITVSNVTGFCVCLIISIYYMSNAATGSFGLIEISLYSLLEFGLYFVAEFLVFLVFIVLFKKTDATYWILLSSMIAFSFLKLGHSYDFAWRTSIPAAFYTMLLIINILVHSQPTKRWTKNLLFLVLILGCVTPFTEIIRTVNHTAAYYSGMTSETLKNDTLDTVFDQENNFCYDNFIGAEDSIFARYLIAK